MNILKKCWNDLLNLSGLRFACIYVFPIVSVFLTWGCLGNFMQNNLEKNQLVKNNGIVNRIDIIFEQGTRRSYKYYPLIISLDGYSENFKIRDKLSGWFPVIREKIHIGDTINIYTRKKLNFLLGWGNKNDIYVIEKNNTDILRAFVMQEYNTTQAIALFVLSLLFWTPYILCKLKIIKS